MLAFALAQLPCYPVQCTEKISCEAQELNSGDLAEVVQALSELLNDPEP